MCSCRQLLESQGIGSNHMAQCVDEQIRILPTIEAKGHFVQVSREVFCADLVPCTDDAALEQREGRFHGIRMNIAVNVDFGLVFDRLVALGHVDTLHGCGVGVEFIRHNYFNVRAHVLLDVLRQRAALDIPRVKESQIAATLPDAHNDLLVGIAVPGLAVGVLLPADVGFIDFDRSVEHGLIYLLHRLADAVTQVPRGLIRAFVLAPESALELTGAHTFACLNQQEHGHEPNLQRQVGIVEDCLCGHAKLVTAFAAFKLRIVGQFVDALALAAKALDAVRPAKFLEQSAALIARRIRVSEVCESHG